MGNINELFANLSFLEITEMEFVEKKGGADRTSLAPVPGANVRFL
jgi:hypothetical protein